jgi:hypothetical protein
MDSSRRRTLIVIAAAAAAGVGAGVAIGLGDDDEPPATDEMVQPPPASPPDQEPRPEPDPDRPEREPNVPPPEKDPEGATPGPSGPAPETSDEQAAATAARGYVQALDRRAGTSVCRAFTPGTLKAVEFPRERGSCAETVEASLGFAGRGLPEWDHSQMTDDVSAKVAGDSAKVVATVFTAYADVREPTIEDDLIYLVRAGDRWLVAKPSLTFYRAIGDPDPPPSALTPP